MKAKPTLEEVKEYFKNVKKIKEESGNEFNIDWETVYFSDYGNWCSDRGNNFYLWSNITGYAKIISYKEETYQITKEQIESIHLEGTTLLKQALKEWFPAVFKEDKKELELNRYYKWSGECPVIGFVDRKTTIEDCYGFKYTTGKMRKNDYNSLHKDFLTLATPQEIQQALENEARKRYKEVKNIKCLCDFHKEDAQEYYKDVKYTFYYEPFVNRLWIQHASFLDICVFNNGIWAEIIPTITIKEAEEKLNCKII